MNNFINIWHNLTKRRKYQLLLLLVLMIFASIFEVVSLGAVVPFLAVLTSPEQVFQYEYIQPLLRFLEINNSNQLILPITITFSITVLIAGSVRLLLVYCTQRLSCAIGSDLSSSIFRRTLYQDYKVHLSRNSSEVINGIITKTNTVLFNVLNPCLFLVSSVIILIGIITTLFFINAKIALSAIIVFSFLYWVVISSTRSHLKRNSEIIANRSTQMVKSLQEGLGGIRDVIINASEEFYYKLYRQADIASRRASGMNMFISLSPRFLIEAIGMILIASLAYLLTLQKSGFATAIPTLGALALGAQRLLPLLQQIYSSYSLIKGSKNSFEDILDLLKQPLPGFASQLKPKPLPFKKEIKLINVNFRYNQKSSWVFKKLNLTISKGTRVGFIGKTGTGKSTLLDIVMGLLPLTEGNLVIDNQEISMENYRDWQANISHVPQNIYLSDSTIMENIAFGVPKEQINLQQVRKAAKQAQIEDLIKSWQDGYETFVGERGIRLSGGQRQRIGIARALYNKCNLLILDEATSALDNETEHEIMQVIKKLRKDITVLIIAHRHSTLKNCDMIVRLLKNNKIKIATYQNMINE